MIPAFVDGTNLPIGGHDCTLAEIEGVFAYNDHRQTLFGTLVELLRLARRCGFLHALLAGSYPTSKEEPKDLDLTWFCRPGTDKTTVNSECIKLMEDKGGAANFQVVPYDKGSLPEHYGEKRALWASPDYFGRDWQTNTPRGVLLLDLTDDNDLRLL